MSRSTKERLYTVDPATGVLTDAIGNIFSIAGSNVGFDVIPTNERFRGLLWFDSVEVVAF